MVGERAEHGDRDAVGVANVGQAGQLADADAVESAREQLPAELRGLLETDTREPLSRGP